MASAGNPNQPGVFDLQKFFKPTNTSPPNPTNPIPSAPFPPSSFPTPPPGPYPTPPLGPYSYPPPTSTPFHNYLHYPQEPLPNVHHPRPVTYPAPPPQNSNPGARLMALLSPNPPLTNQESPSTAEFSAVTAAAVPSAPPFPVPQPTPMRLPSSKLPKGRHLSGDRIVYDIDARMPGEVQPQLEVTPITKYVSDPGLVVGRQIAVNRMYICYGLKLGAIRVLNINTALRSLLRGHTQRVTDMAFFAVDVHLLASSSTDGRVFVWKINEGPDDEDKPQITGKVILAIHIVGDGESFHPRVCWHSHKQEILVVAIGKHVLKIDTTKVGKGEIISAEEPIKCPVEKLVDGVQIVGKHEGEVTDLSMCQWMTTRLVSASTDGTIKIWEDRKALPLLTLRPHGGQPVNSVTFLAAPHRPDHIVLVTGGHLNREVKVWASASEEGWLLPSDSEAWQCTQTLELRSSSEPRAEGVFFNQVVVLPHAALILLANAKKNAIYAIHVEYGLYPAATRMDYIAEFTVTMPILSLTGTSDCSSDGEHVVQVYCVQTQAIQQYALDLSQCQPPSLETMGVEKDANIFRVFEASGSDGITTLEPSHGNFPTEIPFGSASSQPSALVIGSEGATGARYPALSGASEIPSLDSATSGVETKATAFLQATTDMGNIHVRSPSLPLSPKLSGMSPSRSPSNSFEQGLPLGDRGVDPLVFDYPIDRRADAFPTNLHDLPTLDNAGKDDTGVRQSDISRMPSATLAFKHPTHLVTPSEILSKATSSPEIALVAQVPKVREAEIRDVLVKNDVESVEVEVKVVGESGFIQHGEFDSQREQRILLPDKNENSFFTQTSDHCVEMAKECSILSTEIPTVKETHQVDNLGVSDALEHHPTNGRLEDVQDSLKNAQRKVAESGVETAVVQTPSSAVKGKKQKGKPFQQYGPTSPSPSPFNSTDSSNDPGSSSNLPSSEAAFAQIQVMQELLNQLVSMQKETQKQISTLVAVPVNKEGKRLETALNRSIEKAVKANSDALWARMQEEYSKHEKLERDRMQQITNLMTNCVNKDLPAMLEKLKKEISAVGPAVIRAITPVMEKTISSAVAESFQRGVGDKAVNQLEKSVHSKLEATVARQIQAQFQTSGKQALQDAMRSSLESSVIPAFEQSCKVLFEQVDTVFQKGMVEHATAVQQKFESSHSPLAHALREAVSSASSITQSLTGELADGQRKLLALVAAGANPTTMNPLATQLSNGSVGGLHDMALSLQQVEAPLDPMTELQRLISERKFGEAFTSALQRSDVSLVSWLCSQVDLQGILSTIPLPLSQGVLLALLQQLACDISKDTSRKLEWMRDAAVAIDPTDPMIGMHVRPIFEQVYQILGHQRTIPTTTAAEANSIRLVMHVINSVLMSCK